MEGDTLYSVKWYKDDQEFYRFVPNDRPKLQVFKTQGIQVDVSIFVQFIFPFLVHFRLIFNTLGPFILILLHFESLLDTFFNFTRFQNTKNSSGCKQRKLEKGHWEINKLFDSFWEFYMQTFLTKWKLCDLVDDTCIFPLHFKLLSHKDRPMKQKLISSITDFRLSLKTFGYIQGPFWQHFRSYLDRV